MLALDQRQFITNRTIITTDKLPLDRLLVDYTELAEAKVLRVKHRSDIGDLLAGAQRAVRLDVACHAVDQVRHRRAWVGAVGVCVDDRGLVDGAVGAERVETLVPVNVSILY